MALITPEDAQRIVAAYLKVVDADAATEKYPCSINELPRSKDTIRDAFRVSVMSIAALGQLTPELRDYLELAYVSLADYVDEECRSLFDEYHRTGQELAADRRVAREKVTGDLWRRVTEQSALVGRLARGISEEADRLRAEFRSWQLTATRMDS
jgi:hypothetical protein